MTDGQRETIAAVVVTYNRKALLVQCLRLLLTQSYPLDAIYVIDNASTDGTDDDLLGEGLIAPAQASDGGAIESVRTIPGERPETRDTDIHYVRMPENSGGAGGFHEGTKRGRDAGFDWLWLMDDDLEPSREALEALVEKKEALKAAGRPPFLLNSLVLSKEHPNDDTLAFPLQELTAKGYPRAGIYHHHLSDVVGKLEDGLYRWACPFNGTLIPTAPLEQIGLPNKDLFIWGDEREFLWRATKVLDMYTVVDSKVAHPRLEGFPCNWKLYYLIRNAFVVNDQLNLRTLRNLKLIASSLGIGLRHGRKGLALVLSAIKDGLTRNLGKRRDLHP